MENGLIELRDQIIDEQDQMIDMQKIQVVKRCTR